MKIFLGLDGGGTGCRARARLSDGRTTAEHRAGPANVHTDPDGAIATIRALVAETLAEAQAMAAGHAEVQAVLGIAGAVEIGAGPRIVAALDLPRVAVVGDVDLALSGAFEGDDGIIAALGTGSVFARQLSGQMQRVGGYGFQLGDEASGAWIGREAMRRALYARDGLGPAGPLTAALWARFADPGAMMIFARDSRPTNFAAMAPLVIENAAQGCPVAADVLDTATAWVIRAIDRLQPEDRLLPVALMGGVGPVIAARLGPAGGRWPLVSPRGSILDGALWRAERLGAA
ncbi:BadF/BadG/BcrA/BcrD ATPase family protein [Pararhodobacter sp. SW119]|uniref:BadF/BadG/BcrA/BcrD ATPase family protein n=1 Tax=Pararhodobacter sp. SW119 TaxID=2780075 RepID=UPI001ADF4260|nr:BadF/BadG/BcrA/BcrD ATPase family protein [Pararhodobacter sp. SW119]